MGTSLRGTCSCPAWRDVVATVEGAGDGVPERTRAVSTRLQQKRGKDLAYSCFTVGLKAG